jgi:hypothetical protein
MDNWTWNLSCTVKEIYVRRSPLYTKRQVNQHGCLPSFLGEGDKIEIVYGEETKYFVLVRLEQPRQDKNLLYWYDKPHEPTTGRTLSFVLFESSLTVPGFQQSERATPL